MLNVPKNIQNIINKFLEEMTAILGDRIKKVILYGSYARGDYKKDSDIDIMILTDLTDDEIVKYRELIWNSTYDLELDNDVTISAVLKNIDKFDYWLNALPFYTNVNKEGIVLSEKLNIFMVSFT